MFWETAKFETENREVKGAESRAKQALVKSRKKLGKESAG